MWTSQVNARSNASLTWSALRWDALKFLIFVAVYAACSVVPTPLPPLVMACFLLFTTTVVFMSMKDKEFNLPPVLAMFVTISVIAGSFLVFSILSPLQLQRLVPMLLIGSFVLEFFSRQSAQGDRGKKKWIGITASALYMLIFVFLNEVALIYDNEWVWIGAMAFQVLIFKRFWVWLVFPIFLSSLRETDRPTHTEELN